MNLHIRSSLKGWDAKNIKAPVAPGPLNAVQSLSELARDVNPQLRVSVGCCHDLFGCYVVLDACFNWQNQLEKTPVVSGQKRPQAARERKGLVDDCGQLTPVVEDQPVDVLAGFGWYDASVMVTKQATIADEVVTNNLGLGAFAGRERNEVKERVVARANLQWRELKAAGGSEAVDGHLGRLDRDEVQYRSTAKMRPAWVGNSYPVQVWQQVFTRNNGIASLFDCGAFVIRDWPGLFDPLKNRSRKHAKNPRQLSLRANLRTGQFDRGFVYIHGHTVAPLHEKRQAMLYLFLDSIAV